VPGRPWRASWHSVATMNRILLSGVLGLTLGSSSIGLAAPARPLTATVARNHTVSVVDASGRAVARLRPGQYVLTVRDRSSKANFHLVGPTGGPSRRTRLRFVGKVRWRVFLVRGRYRYFSDSRPSAVHYFTVS
jgi:hypothetical protein